MDLGAVLLAVWDAHSSCIGAHGTAILCALPLCFCYLVTIITYYLGYCKQKSDNFNLHECRRGGKSLRRRLCTLRAVCGLVSMVQIRSYVHPLCDIWAAPHGRIFLLRSYPHKPNRARRAQSVHVPNCGYVPNRGNGARQRIITLPVAEGHHAASRTPQSTACEVYPNRRRAFWGTLDRSIERSRASPRSGRSKGPRTLRVREGHAQG